MASVTFTDARGQARRVDIATGLSLMEGAIKAGVPGIDADCGGACACATCHVLIAPEWMAAAGMRSEAEDSMLDFAPEVGPTSRLSCQITITAALDGLRVRTPTRQG